MARMLFVDNREEAFKTLCNRMNEFRKRNELVDFTLYNDRGDELNGHMVIMSITCLPIRNMVNSGSRRFLLDGVCVEAMEQLLNFMYLGEMEIAADTVDGIMRGSVDLGIMEVETACLDFMALNEVEIITESWMTPRSRRNG